MMELEIRSNITEALDVIERARIAREDAERKEREAKAAKEREERERLDAEWKVAHPILDKFTYISRYNYEGYSWQGMYYNVHFYEWSNIESEPRRIPYSVDFYKFLDECKLNLTEALNNKIKACNGGVYITCKPGTHDLIVGDSYESLKSQYNTVINGGAIEEEVPVGSASTNNVPACYPSRCYDYYDDD